MLLACRLCLVTFKRVFLVNAIKINWDLTFKSVAIRGEAVSVSYFVSNEIPDLPKALVAFLVVWRVPLY